ncbi:MAG: DUF1573 domain-containing protein [Phycisphaerae bacterium]|nr:DUF1573 domain-containing protein [Phycisphaerae bacterium]
MMRSRTGFITLGYAGFVAIALAAAAHAADTQPPAIQAPAKPKIELSSELWNFGEIWFGEKLEQKVTIKNTGNAELRIESVRASCGCTASKAEKNVLAPGEETTASVSFDSHKRQGQVSTQVTFVSNDPDRKQVVFYLKGFVKRVLNYEPAGGVVIHSTDRTAAKSGTGVITATTAEPIKLEIVRVDAPKFDVTLKEIVAGQKYEVTAVVKPPLETGRTVGNVVLKTGNEREPELNLPIVATVYDKVELSPAAIFLEPTMTPDRTERTVSVHYRGENLEFAVLNVDVPSDDYTANFGKVRPAGPEWQRLGDSAPKMMVDIKFSLPPGKSLPPQGVTVMVQTNEPGFEQVPLLITPDGTAFNAALRKTQR